MDHDATGPATDDAEVADVARRIVGDPQAELLEWTTRPIAHVGIIGTTGGLHFVSGRARSQGEDVAWSCVLKVLLRPPQGECLDPSSWCYWRRESAFFRSGLATRLPGALRAPTPFGVFDGEAHSHVWMERVEAPPRRWKLNDFRRAARAAGASAGAFLTGRPLPDEPWLARGFLRSTMADGGYWATTMHPESGDAWRSPLAERFGPATRQRVLRLWADREEFLASVEALPLVFGHGDFHPRNLLLPTDGGDDVVALDWAFCGPAPLGADIGDLVWLSAWFCDVEAGEVPAIAHAALTAYEDAVRTAGWDGDARLVHLGYAASIAVRAAACMPGWAAWLLAPDRAPSSEVLYGRPTPSILAAWIALEEYCLDMADAAQALARQLEPRP